MTGHVGVEEKVSGAIIVEAPPEIRITLRGMHRLELLLSKLERASQAGGWRLLRAEVERAVLVDDPEAGPPFVRIGSAVTFRDERGRIYEGTLALPGQSLDRPDAIPIVTPVGAALLGLSAGQSITYETADGRSRSLTVLEVIDKP